MDQNKAEEARSQLEAKKAKVVKQLEGIGKKTDGAETNYDASFPEYGQAAEDNATEIADYTTNLSLEKELEEEMRKIDRALNKITEGTYGVCDNCNGEIEPNRLAIMPEATWCMACQRK